MIDLLVNTQLLPLIMLGGLALVFLFQVIFYLIFFLRLGRNRTKPGNDKPEGVSVVICARNEFHKLKVNLPLILDQDYPEYEVLVVNHASDDDTRFLLTQMEEQYPNLKSIVIQEDLNFFSGKKFPLSIGIRSAKYDIVLLTDADCRPASRNWIRAMQQAYRPGIEVVLGYGPYNRMKGLLNKLIRFDTAHVAMQYLSYALAGIPYMGVGRNLSYRKAIFYRNKGFISHYHIRSGDDDLFINSVARRKNTAVVADPESYTFSEPKETLGRWITQKKRHFSTSTHYRLRHRLLLGMYSFSLIAFYCIFALMLSLRWSPYPVLGLFGIRLIMQYVVFHLCLKRLNEKDLLIFVPVFEVMLLLLNAGVMISNLFRKPTKWK